MTAANLSALLQRFFTERLQAQLGASPHTIASYRDTFRLLLVFASARLARAPSQLRVDDLDATLIGAFLDHLEHERACTPKTRNTRLAAVRAFFRFVAYAEPACSRQCQQVLVVPNKRHEHPTVEFLAEDETAALLAAPDVTHVDRPSRPDPATRGRADWLAQHRDPVSSTPRCAAWCGPARTLFWQGAQNTLHSVTA